MAVRACDHCGASFEAVTARARYCSNSCRALASKARRGAAPAESSVTTLPGHDPRGAIERRVSAELGGQVETSLGLRALALARRLDAGVMDSSLRAVDTRLDELLEKAVRLNAATADADADNPIAFLQQRAEARRARAAG